LYILSLLLINLTVISKYRSDYKSPVAGARSDEGKARALFEPEINRRRVRECPEEKRTGGGFGAAFLAYFFLLMKRSRAGSGAAGPY